MERKSILDGVNEHDVVTVHNPLSDTFIVKFGRSVVVSNPQRALQQTGNPFADKLMYDIQAGGITAGHQSTQHVQQELPIASGHKIRLPGNLAKIAVRQIVKEMMQRMGAKKQMADPNFIMEYEKKVVLNHESMLTNLSVESLEEKLERQLKELNPTEEVESAQDEQPFPTESARSTGATAPDDNKAGETAQRSPGRPRAK